MYQRGVSYNTHTTGLKDKRHDQATFDQRLRPTIVGNLWSTDLGRLAAGNPVTQPRPIHHR